MKMLFRLAAAAALLIAGCSLPTSPEDALHPPGLSTDRSTYQARQTQEGARPLFAFELVARFYNTSQDVVHLDRCYGGSDSVKYSLQDAESGAGTGYGAVWACSAGPPIDVGPGETRSDTLTLHGPSTWDSSSNRHSGPLEGRFRIRYYRHGCTFADACNTGDSLLVSAPFEVDLVLTDSTGYREETVDQLVGTWQWLWSRGGRQDHTVWPGTSTHDFRRLEIDRDGTYRLYEIDSLLTTGTHQLRVQGIDRTLTYAPEYTAAVPMLIDQYLSFKDENTLMLEDRHRNDEGYLHAFVRTDE